MTEAEGTANGMQSDLPDLSGAEATLQTLSFYAKAIGVIPRALAPPHPRWWHISLKLREEGAATDLMPHPTKDGATIQLVMNLQSHAVEIAESNGAIVSVGMAGGLPASDFGDALLAALRAVGVELEVERELFEDDGDRSYDPAQAEAYRRALVAVNQILTAHRDSLPGERGPIQLWPHNFDLAFEWFGTRTVRSQGKGEVSEQPAQINFGFSPGDRSHPEPYFYSNPWPFVRELMSRPLPSGARWFAESWQGSLLPYAALTEPPMEALLGYFRAVFDLASPLMLK